MNQINLFHENEQKISSLLGFNLPIDKDRKLDKKDITSYFLEIWMRSRDISALPILPLWANEIRTNELARGIGGTIRIEGNTLTDEEVKSLITQEQKEAGLTIADQEAINSNNAYEFCLEWISNNPNGEISIPLIKEIHKKNTQNIHYPANLPGEFRRYNRQIGYPPRNTLLEHSWDIEEHMRKFVQWINNPNAPEGWENSTRDLIKPILAHYYFSEIHPFGDGNGRTARTLEALMLYRSNRFNRFGFYAMANYAYQNREKYIDLLGEVYTKEDITNFLLFNLEALRYSLDYVHNQIIQKIRQMAFEDILRQKRSEKKITTREEMIVRLLMTQEKMALGDLIKQNLFRVSRTTYYRYIKNLQKENLVNITSNSENPKQSLMVPNYDILNDVSFVVT